MKISKGLVILTGVLCLIGLAGAMVSTNFNLGWHVIGGGGGPMSSTNYRMAGTVGQIIGVSESMNYRLETGYWYGTAAPPTDTQAPAAITDLATSNPTSYTIKLSWTAPGDDGTTGTATTYDIRYRVGVPITEASWATATEVMGEPAPKPAGSSETFTVTGLSAGTTYYFAIKTADEKPNWSPISNSPSGTTVEKQILDTGASATPYPSIPGTHNGTIILTHDVTVSKLYTYPCAGTGGHTKYAGILSSNGTLIAEAYWNGYEENWHNITFNNSFTLDANETYNYTIRTGSYPQIIHASSHNATGGVITCEEFVDINGKQHENWIPAIRLE
jgi:hypothetical protein